MKLTGRAKEEPEVNMTSLIDVVLLLLIFFMVTAAFTIEAAFPSPASEQEEAASNPEPVAPSKVPPRRMR